MKKCVIIDYGLCNLLSVANALRYLGVKSHVSAFPEDLQKADCAILPGVGAFEDGMKGLQNCGLIAPIHDFVKTGRPFLGICLGMELFLTKSYEFGEHQGLNLIPGEVLPFQKPPGITGQLLKVPHVGWSSLQQRESKWEGSLLDGIPNQSEMYFVHSFYVSPTDKRNVLAETEYGGKFFCSVVSRGNIYGCQFHPEKSADQGLRIFSNFLKMNS